MAVDHQLEREVDLQLEEVVDPQLEGVVDLQLGRELDPQLEEEADPQLKREADPQLGGEVDPQLEEEARVAQEDIEDLDHLGDGRHDDAVHPHLNEADHHDDQEEEPGLQENEVHHQGNCLLGDVCLENEAHCQGNEARRQGKGACRQGNAAHHQGDEALGSEAYHHGDEARHLKAILSCVTMTPPALLNLPPRAREVSALKGPPG